MLRLLIVLVTVLMAAGGLVVGVVVALGVAWIAVALPVLILLGLAGGVLAVWHWLWPRGSENPSDSSD